MQTESSFNPKARSHIPAYGLMQLVPKSGARDAFYHVYKKDRLLKDTYLYVPANNIELGCAYINKIRYAYFKNIKDDKSAYYCTISAYNTGAGNVARALTGKTKLKAATNKVNSMNPDILIVRHPEEGISEKISKLVDASVINAGDGSNEHPTQALLDALTIHNRFKNFSKLKIAICGDILHSRVARSNIEILSKLGANINVIGPKELIPKNICDYPVNVFHSMKKGLQNCDIVMMLRIQKERIVGKFMSNEKAYFKRFGLDYEKLNFAKKNAFVMHPGPMNRGVEIDSILADDITRSLIQEQVAMGVAIRMACLEIIIKNRDIYVK